MMLAHTLPTQTKLPDLHWSLELTHTFVSEPAVSTSALPHPITVLVVSNCPVTLDMFRQLAAVRDWQMLEAASMRQVWAALLREPVSVVITDEQLPGGTWKDVVSETASLTATPVVLVMSAAASQPLWEEVLSHGGVDVLKQPLDVHEIEQAITAAIKEERREETVPVALAFLQAYGGAR